MKNWNSPINTKANERKALEERLALEKKRNASYKERLLTVKADFLLKIINLLEATENSEKYSLSDLIEALKIIKVELKEATEIKEIRNTTKFIEILEE